MTGIFFDPARTSIRSYGSSSKGNRSIVKVEIETDDPYELGHLLEQIGRAKRECDAAGKAADPTPKPAKPAKPRAVSRQAMFLLPYLGGSDDRD